MVMRAINTKTSSPRGQRCQKPNPSSWQATQAAFRHLGSKRAARHAVQTHDWTDVSLSWHPTIPARSWSSRVTPAAHQRDGQPWMRQSQAPLATREGTCLPRSTPELLCSQRAVTG